MRTCAITIKDFTTLKVLGVGTYGKVLLVLHKRTGKSAIDRIIGNQTALSAGGLVFTATAVKSVAAVSGNNQTDAPGAVEVVLTISANASDVAAVS